jgi:RNA polymerase sigma-70 factor (ECF subfamily)
MTQLPADLEARGIDPSDQLIFNDCLDRLPADQRVVFVCVAMEGMTLQESADLLGIAVATAHGRYHRARQNMRECMRGEMQ